MGSGFYRTSGGWVVELDRPLTKLMQEQADRGELRRVQPDRVQDGPNEDPKDDDWTGYQGKWVDWDNTWFQPEDEEGQEEPEQTAGAPVTTLAANDQTGGGEGSSQGQAADPATPEGQVAQGAQEAAQASPTPSLPQPPKAGPGSSRQDWVLYAKSKDSGLTDEQLDGMNRAELVEKYGSDG